MLKISHRPEGDGAASQPFAELALSQDQRQPDVSQLLLSGNRFPLHERDLRASRLQHGRLHGAGRIARDREALRAVRPCLLQLHINGDLGLGRTNRLNEYIHRSRTIYHNKKWLYIAACYFWF